ncbi:mitochondrial 54S ribosomal protein uL23m [Aspergillus aculeatinus CBS 121060]|uniref:Large ribosomal subunit protein uL23m n=3 Tax=Aspergillus TaxID=5052 RepID=A0A8G1W0Y7_9EURO|nr:ribosomal protein L23 family protein [Aspergillus brunneoviolaceus CBS 621.78]XP_025503449.1 ribosomal protein L23 family protein [Aspergillus aculeatinus CBS 121060]XP_040803887.1 ribosomal protein L23 family protein [Aspergillus fijiensis CBS 313.89]RAH44432.1 ribosomal protein L23 family protein [Aspergillus brunneoviolaceus CBS 621.78]RAH69626.1 ribosomal protein L23 family protein [Aspergillus aculeatinus CBS 121060]RAK79877.1 ribosomal protein L23 family protein [Aspergillus fijiensis
MVRKLTQLAKKVPTRPEGWVGPGAPLEARKQVFLPDFTIALIRTPFLPPRYASFYVPLNLNKLDMRDYLQRAYGVGVLAVRSFVEQQKVTRMKSRGRFGYGPLRRPQSKKRMTVEMKEPFVWPEAPKEMDKWEKDQYYKAAKWQQEMQDAQKPEAGMLAPTKERESYAAEAEKILSGEKPWRPTWQALGLNYDRAVRGKAATSPKDGSRS